MLLCKYFILSPQPSRPTLSEPSLKFLVCNVNHQQQPGAPHLYGAVGIQEEVPAADAAVDAAQGHVEAEGEEVALIEVANAVVEPSWVQVESKSTKVWVSCDWLSFTEGNIFPTCLTFFGCGMAEWVRCGWRKGYDSGGPSSEHTWDTDRRDTLRTNSEQTDCVGESLFLLLHVADAAMMRPGRLWGDALLTEGHRGNVDSLLNETNTKTRFLTLGAAMISRLHPQHKFIDIKINTSTSRVVFMINC